MQRPEGVTRAVACFKEAYFCDAAKFKTCLEVYIFACMALGLPNFGLKFLNETIGALARIGRKLGDNPIAPAQLDGTA